MRVVLAIVMTFLVLAVSSSIGLSVIGPQNVATAPPWQMPSIIHVSILILSFLLILILSKGRISSYGLKFASNFPFIRLVLICTGIGIIAAAIESLIGTGGPSPTEGFTLVQKIIFIWLIASICEETLFRGLIQGFLSQYTGRGIRVLKTTLSLPVLVAAILFALIHFGLLGSGMNFMAVVNIVIFAFILGIMAGLYRESTGSIIPAIIIHMLFNIGGTLMEYVISAFAG